MCLLPPYSQITVPCIDREPTLAVEGPARSSANHRQGKDLLPMMAAINQEIFRSQQLRSPAHRIGTSPPILDHNA